MTVAVFAILVFYAIGAIVALILVQLTGGGDVGSVFIATTIVSAWSARCSRRSSAPCRWAQYADKLRRAGGTSRGASRRCRVPDGASANAPAVALLLGCAGLGAVGAAAAGGARADGARSRGAAHRDRRTRSLPRAARSGRDVGFTRIVQRCPSLPAALEAGGVGATAGRLAPSARRLSAIGLDALRVALSSPAPAARRARAGYRDAGAAVAGVARRVGPARLRQLPALVARRRAGRGLRRT